MDTVIGDVKWLNHNESFIKTAAYNTLLRREQKTLLILHGRGGVGKTQLAVQVQAALQVEHERSAKPLCLAFNCESIEKFYNSVESYNKEFHLGLVPNTGQPISVRTLLNAFEKLVDILRHDVNAQQFKCLLFDGADPKGPDGRYGYVLECIEKLIIHKIKRGGKRNELRSKWKILVTTSKTLNEWLQTCRDADIDETNFCEVKEFDREQTCQYLDIADLERETKENLHDTVDGLQYALTVIKATLVDSTVVCPKSRIEMFIQALRRDDQTAIISRILLKVQPKIDSKHERLMKLISLYDEKYLFSCLLREGAAVVLDKADDRKFEAADRSIPDDPADEAHLISKALKNQGLATIIGECTKQRIVDVSKLILPSVRVEFKKHSPEEKQELIILALIVLTQTMPAEGRVRLSMDAYSYFLSHGRSLRRHIERLLLELEPVSPLLMFLNAVLLDSMAYCQMVRREPLEAIEKDSFTSEALDKFSLALCGENYKNLVPSHPLDDTKKASYLAEKVQDCVQLVDDPDYKYVVKLLQNLPMSARETNQMFPGEPKAEVNIDDCLTEQSRIRLDRKHRKMENPYLIYVFEKLIKFYITGAMVPHFYWSSETNGSRLFQPKSYADAAIVLCELVTAKYSIPLRLQPMAERLKIGMQAQQEPLKIGEHRAAYKALREKEVDGEYWYENGLGTTNFSTDPMFQYVCSEDELLCQGLICHNYLQSANQTEAGQHIQAGKLKIEVLLGKCKEFKDHKTLAKLRMKEAMFLYWAKDLETAIRSVLDAMISYDLFLQESGFKSKSEYTLGLFKNLHDMLKEYWLHWRQENRTRYTMLERGSDDGARLDFIKKFLQTYGNADQFEALNYLGSKKPVGVEATS